MKKAAYTCTLLCVVCTVLCVLCTAFSLVGNSKNKGNGSEETSTDVLTDTNTIGITDLDVDTNKPTTDTVEEQTPDETEPEQDEWADAINGMKLITIKKPSFNAYMLLIRDPSRIYVGTSGNFSDSNVSGIDVFELVATEGCIAAINGGAGSQLSFEEYAPPIGMTYSKGKCVWNEATTDSFIGIDKDNKLVVLENITKEKATELGIRDGVCFQSGDIESVLVTNDGTNITVHKFDDTSRGKRTAIGQRADGTIIMLVADGRTTFSIGANYNDITEIMVEYGAVTAGMLTMKSNSMLYYENYFELYPDMFNYDWLTQFQKKGLVNRYISGSGHPIQIPTYFCVAPEK